MGKTVGTIETTLRVIESVHEHNGIGVTDIANELELPKSTVHSHLQTLREQHYLVKEGDKYALGLKFLKLGTRSRNRLYLFDHACPEVNDLAEQSGEIVNLAVQEFGRGVYLYRSQGEKAVHLDTYAGMRFYLHCTALGKVLLAHIPTDEVESVLDIYGLPKRTNKTITDREVLFDELDTIREQGYAYDDEERLPGLRCVAAPIIDEGHAIGSISIAGPMSRMKGERYRTEFPDLLMNAANVVELNLKYY